MTALFSLVHGSFPAFGRWSSCHPGHCFEGFTRKAGMVTFLLSSMICWDFKVLLFELLGLIAYTATPVAKKPQTGILCPYFISKQS